MVSIMINNDHINIPGYQNFFTVTVTATSANLVNCCLVTAAFDCSVVLHHFSVKWESRAEIIAI